MGAAVACPRPVGAVLSIKPNETGCDAQSMDIVRKAALTPLRQIAENAGEDGAVISGKILEHAEYNWGFDAQSGEFKDMVKAGIIDPTKVVRTALQHAASVASLMITTEAMVADRAEKQAVNGDDASGNGMGNDGY